MTEENRLGTWPEANDQRDATHVAHIAARCSADFRCGDKVLLSSTELGFVAEYDPHDNYDGVIDPFLPRDPKKGELVYILMRPGSILSLRHEWYHPKAQHPDKLKMANLRLDKFAKEIGSDVDELLSKANSYVHYGDCWSEGARFDGGVAMYKEFWEDYQTVTGKLVDPEDQDYFFSCAC